LLWLTPLFAGTVALGLLRCKANNQMDWLCWALVIVGTSSVAMSVCVYQFNILLPYEVWLKRGMPQRPF
jgi:hypothetical protein